MERDWERKRDFDGNGMELEALKCHWLEKKHAINPHNHITEIKRRNQIEVEARSCQRGRRQRGRVIEMGGKLVDSQQPPRRLPKNGENFFL